MSNWVLAMAVDDIKDGGAKSLRRAEKRIALFRTPRGVFASAHPLPASGLRTGAR